ncbi:MAG: hypothetical protein K2I95_06310 [Treponemataceae bacterium]|nr:hypothetical protein [Treponemataceae bacterium]
MRKIESLLEKAHFVGVEKSANFKAEPDLKFARHYNGNFKRAFVFAVALLFSAFSFAQETNSQGLENPEAFSRKEIYKIAAVNYAAQGITKESALARNVEIEEGKKFESREDLEAYILDIKQKLINARLFDMAEVEYTLTMDADEDGYIPVAINVVTVDSRHFLLLPYPKYDSNEGFELKIKFKDANFLGTMSEMEADTFFRFEQKDGQENDFVLGGNFGYDLPFTLGKIEASWNNDFSFEYAFVRGEPEWNFQSGFTFVLPFENIALRLDLTQGTTRDLDYKKFNDELFFTERAKFSVPIRLETIPGIGDIVYTPAAEIVYNWDLDGIDILDEDLVSPKLTFSHGISAGRVNWYGNFRKGFSAGIFQSAAYNFQLNEFQPGIELRAEAFFAWNRAALASRLTLFAEFDSYRRYGHLLRGIPDDQYFSPQTGMDDVYACKSASALILNLDVPIKIFSTRFEKGWLKNFNFEMQISPFVDIALTQNRSTGKTFSPKDGFYTCGIEMLFFPEKWKSVQLRASIGFDMGRILFKNAVDTSWRDENTSIKEISLGVGLFY